MMDQTGKKGRQDHQMSDRFIWRKGDVRVYKDEKAWREAMKAQGMKIITPRK